MRRKAKRNRKKQNQCSQYDDFDQVFSYNHLYLSYKKCRRNVAWKSSVQKYITQAPLRVLRTYNQLHAGKFKSEGFYEFNINERGKVRHIKSVTIGERVVQRCLCDYALVPMLSRTFIYDNSASLKGKGYHFALNRLCKHLKNHYRKYGQIGYILIYDFSSFFDNISHKVCKEILRREFTDSRLIALIEHLIDAFGERGLGLGSQISQIFALACANNLDHYIKEVCHIKGYGRYMDDGYLIHNSKEELEKVLKVIRQICKELGIKLNERKTRIVKLSRGFTFLKARIFLLETGKIIKKIPKDSVTRERRKLKKLQKFLCTGKLTFQDIYSSYQSWRSYATNFNSYKTVQTMNKLYTNLFINVSQEIK